MILALTVLDNLSNNIIVSYVHLENFRYLKQDSNPGAHIRQLLKLSSKSLTCTSQTFLPCCDIVIYSCLELRVVIYREKHRQFLNKVAHP